MPLPLVMYSGPVHMSKHQNRARYKRHNNNKNKSCILARMITALNLLLEFSNYQQTNTSY